MKRLFFPLLLSFLLITPVILNAQKRDRIIHKENMDKKQIQFGYYLGLNKKGFEIKYNDSFFLQNVPVDYVLVEESMGFNIGLSIQYRLTDNIGLRLEPGLSSNTKTLKYNSDVIGANGFQNQGLERDISGTYLRFPLLLKLSTNRLDNMRAFVIGGVSYDYNFSSNQKNSEDNLSRQFRMKTSNFMYEVGLGVDIYLPYFKFSPSIRGIFAINNEIVQDNIASPYTEPIKYFGTRGVFLNLTFE